MTQDTYSVGNKDSKNIEANKFQQGRAVVGARMQQQPQQQNNQWNSQYHSKQRKFISRSAELDE